MKSSGLAQRLPRLWFRPRLSCWLIGFLPLSWLFGMLSSIRRLLYRSGVLRAGRLPVPVVVIGNLTVGGSGKTPLVLWLVERLREQGWKPAIISRGYAGSADGVRAVTADSQASEVGDEPLLLAQRSGVPVFVGRDRVAAGAALLAWHPPCNVIVSDDGLQHYRLHRDAEIVVFDGRGEGNGHLLPAGPLREPLARLSSVTAIVWNSAPGRSLPEATVPQARMALVSDAFYALNDSSTRCVAADLRGRQLFAMAGIGDPSRFFAQLQYLGLEFEARPFPDHQAYSEADLAFAKGGVLLMTEKDAVKCRHLPIYDAWVVPVAAEIEAVPGDPPLLNVILEKINGCSPA